ncbi:Energy-coupling factor transporter ATP-binding protein EcfA1 [compost metagenome]
MLDPVARRRFVETLHEVRQRVPFTLIYITHHLEEVMGADRWVLFREGRIVTSGPPSELQKDTQLLHDCGLELPYYYKLAELLRRSGISAPATLSEQELRGLLCRSS